MCPTGNYSQSRKSGFMSEELYLKIVEEIAPYKTPLRFIRWGEPTSHPKIHAFLQAAKDRDILLHLNTNGSYLSDKMMEFFIDLPLDSLKFSFQGVDQKSYAEMRNIDFFDELLSTIRRLHEKRGRRPFPYILTSTTVTYESKDSISAFKEEVRCISDDVNVGRTNFEYLDLDAVRLRPDEVEMLKRLKDVETLVKVHPECPEVYDKLSINWDGTVSACCWDSDKKMLIGDVSEQSLAEIWHSPILNEYRSILAEMRHDDLLLCKDCYDTHSLVNPGVQDT
jgi:radical SAM protein with 4Fe4S-binding SPASM domain